MLHFSRAATTFRNTFAIRTFSFSMPNLHATTQRFADARISRASKQGIKHEFMTDVQAATLEPAKAGHDLIVQAKTGTGKTLAFLLPAIERLIETSPTPTKGISILVVAPTRELALQTTSVAQPLLAAHGLSARHVIGGTNINSERAAMERSDCHILVATPGRLLDHLSDSRNPISRNISNLKCLIYDEADRLLDQGFKRDLEKIHALLPSADERQHLLFSATFSDEIKAIAKILMRPGFRFISTLTPDEVNTHLHVPQTHVSTPFPQHLSALLAVLKDDLKAHGKANSKCICFFPTAQQTSLFHSLFTSALSRDPTFPRVYAIHSRQSQSQRTRVSNEFASNSSGWLFSSDVTARGMDFPNVTSVVQVGVPSAPEQYIHRLGRTARAGAQGKGVIILDPVETPFLNKGPMRSINIESHTLSRDNLLEEAAQLQPAIDTIDQEAVRKAYQSWLGFYRSSRVFPSTREMVTQLNETVRSWGWKAELPPALSSMVVGKMGISDRTGLNVVSGGDSNRRPSGGSRRQMTVEGSDGGRRNGKVHVQKRASPTRGGQGRKGRRA